MEGDEQNILYAKIVHNNTHGNDPLGEEAIVNFNIPRQYLDKNS